MKKKSIIHNKRVNRAYNYVMKSPKICKQAKKECLMMCEIANQTKGTIVEIGRKHGGSLVLLCICSPSSKIYSIDISPQHDKNVLKLCNKFRVSRNQYELIIGDSIEVSRKWNKQIDLLFVDGDHSTEAVYKDMVSWVPYVKPNGSILVHDYFPLSHPKRREIGPYNALQQYMSKYNNLQVVTVIQKMCVVKKISL